MAKAKYGRPLLRKSSTPSSTLILALFLLFSVLVLILLALGIVSIPSINPSASHQVNDLSSIVHNAVHRADHVSKERDQQWVELLSWEPRAFVYHNFLSKEECEYLIKLASPRMEKVRTSSGTFLARGRDKIIRTIEQRIADFTFLPVDHGEGLQVLHYEVGQRYEPHFDYFLEDYSTANGGQRIATVLMYLSDVEEGGETVFPSAKGNISAVPYWNELSKCGKEGLSVKPNRGDALLFWSMKPDASLDPLSLHGGCPVIKGNKWSATKWIRVNAYHS
uniref:procollagen-proline 4-dioxygenase n=1 Tax=Chenopodium quinoa TaxID=63459 RepID=A0A803MAW0_CHEQI